MVLAYITSKYVFWVTFHISQVMYHFDNSKPKIDMFGYDNNYQTKMLNFIAGYRRQLVLDQLIAPFRPLYIIGFGGMSDLK